MKTVFKIWLALCVALAPTFGFADAVIFSGTDVKTLKQNVDLFGVVKILSGTVDPTSSATSAPIGSLYLNSSNGNTYRKLDAGSSTNWATVGAGSDSGTNYIKNGNALVNTTGWAAYADAAGAVPVDCTGGSPTTTFTRTTTSPLDAANSPGSFLLTHPASNAQGEGAAYPFTISDSDKAKVLTIEMEQLVDSGTFVAGTASVDSDVKVYIYDVTNGVLIHPSTSKLYSNNGALTEKFSSTFQTASNSNSYRLCLHNATTATSAFALKLGRIKVSPTAYVYGTPITDWVQYTPVFTGLGTVTAIDIWSRRVGDSLQIQGKWVNGTPTAVTASMQMGFNGVSGGVFMSTTKVASTKIVGVGSRSPANVAAVTVLATAGQGSLLNFSLDTQATQQPNVASLGNAAFGTGEGVYINALIPIEGWSSSVQMSDNSDTRIVSFAGSQTSQAVTANVTNINFTASKDSHGAWNGSQFTVPVAGDYVVGASLVTSVGGVTALPFVNGSAHTGLFSTSSAGGQVTSGAVLVASLKAGDLISIRSNATITVTAGSVSIWRLSGPNAIAATEKVAVRYYGLNGVTSTTTGGVVKYFNKGFDTHGAYSASTGLFTAPSPGIYRVTVGMNNSSAANSGAYLYVGKNGNTELARLVTAVLLNGTYSGSALIDVAPGDTLGIYSSVNTLSLADGTSYAYINIEKVN